MATTVEPPYVDWCCSSYAAAARRGHLACMHRIYAEEGVDAPFPKPYLLVEVDPKSDAGIMAAVRGDVVCMEWLHVHGGIDDDVLKYAIAAGQLASVAYLHTHGQPLQRVHVMQIAAQRWAAGLEFAATCGFPMDAHILNTVLDPPQKYLVRGVVPPRRPAPLDTYGFHLPPHASIVACIQFLQTQGLPFALCEHPHVHTHVLADAVLRGDISVLMTVCDEVGTRVDARTAACTTGTDTRLNTYVACIEYLRARLGGSLPALMSAVQAEACVRAAQRGDVDTLVHLHQEHGVDLEAAVPHAAQHGHLACLQYMVTDAHVRPRHADAFTRALENGHLECFQFLHAHMQMRLTEVSCEAVTFGGHLDCFAALYDRGGTWSGLPGVLFAAVAAGYLDCARYAMRQHLERVNLGVLLQPAAMEGDVIMLRFLRAHGALWHAEVTQCAIDADSLACVRYAHEDGCPWTDRARWSVEGNGFRCEAYVLAHTCPNNAGACAECVWRARVTSVCARALRRAAATAPHRLRDARLTY